MKDRSRSLALASGSEKSKHSTIIKKGTNLHFPLLIVAITIY
jgi:hypothetical protein